MNGRWRRRVLEKLTTRTGGDTMLPAASLPQGGLKPGRCVVAGSATKSIVPRGTWRRFMAITYFKRYRMEYDLRGLYRPPLIPEGYRFVPWSDSLIEAHADTKYRCFRFELDANVFPCLGDRDGCLRLMNEIARRQGFMEGATWLLQTADDCEYCGTIQGIVDLDGLGSIQNLGVTPKHRGRGLGSGLLYHALAGFREAGLRRAFLEVTAQNVGAVRLYQRLGFRKVKTLYKAADLACV